VTAEGDHNALAQIRAGFDPLWYLQAYPDVARAGLDPLAHYLATGQAEGRQPGPSMALEFDHMLWRGFAGVALPELERLLREGPPREQAGAGWALARWHADRQEAEAARRAILTFHHHPEGLRLLRHPGPFLLGVQLCLACGDLHNAVRLLQEGVVQYGWLPDFRLAALLCDRARDADDWEIEGHLHRLYTDRGLWPVRLDPGEGPRLDRLTALAPPETGEGPQPGAAGPLVSVIVPVFNAARTLPTALRGLLAQSWQTLEILVVDDGSEDASPAIAADFAARDPRIRLLPPEGNQGAYPARNRGLAAARGQFITVHDADDWSHPQKIARQAEALLADPGAQATVSHWVRASDDLEMTRWRMEDRWVHRNVSSLMIRAALRDSLGYWDRVKVNADTEYYYRILKAFGPGGIREVMPGVPLSFGRSHPQSLTQASATHLRSQLHGLRRDYMNAAWHWHKRAGAATGPGLFMPQHPDCRLFRVPSAIGLGDPEGPPSRYDLVTGSALFDPDWYQLSNPDVLRADIGPATHYIDSGSAEDRDPGPGFSTGGYRLAQGLGPEVNPLVHYEAFGRTAGHDPLPGFDGALAGSDLPRVLVFAHAAGKRLFGAERSLLDMLGRLRGRGFAPVVVVPVLRNPDYLARLRDDCARVETLPQLWRHALRAPCPATVAGVRALIRRHAAREVHVNTLVLEAPLVAARAEGCASVVHVREYPPEDAALCRGLGMGPEDLRAALLDGADRFVVASPLVADWLGVPDRVTIRPNAVDPALFDLPFDPVPVLRVALVSSNIAKKGLVDFLAVARAVGSRTDRVRFAFIGPPTQDLHLLRPFPDNVEFRGYAEDPVAAMAQADVVMSLSKFAESFGRTVLEAMAAGRPVICYDRGTPPLLVQQGLTGLVVPADDTAAAARAVLALEAARGQLPRLSQAARAAARDWQARALEP